MRNKSFATLGILGLLATASAFGQSRLKADIPFEFRVGDTVMPAGQYDVNLPAIGGPDRLYLTCYKCRATTSAATQKVGALDAHTAKGRLVFNRYGDTYFLSEAWSRNSGVGTVLLKSKTEREATRRASQTPTTEVVLARR
jgi:hypothetical protein